MDGYDFDALLAARTAGDRDSRHHWLTARVLGGLDPTVGATVAEVERILPRLIDALDEPEPVAPEQPGDWLRQYLDRAL